METREQSTTATTQSEEQETLGNEETETEKNNNSSCEITSKIERIQVIVSFVGFGALLHCIFAIIVSGAQDILAGTFIPTTSIILSHVTPIVVVTSTAPWFMQRVSYLVRVLAIFFFMAVGLLLIIFVDNVYVKICGVASNALSHGLGEITFLALSTFYSSTAVASFAAGSGAGMLLGPVYYSGTNLTVGAVTRFYYYQCCSFVETLKNR